MAKNVTGRQVTAYTGNAAYFSSSLRTKKCPAQKDTRMAAMDTKRDDNPSNSFLGRSLRKSFTWYLEVRMARNMTTEVTEKQRATSDEIANMRNAGWRSSMGLPLSSLMPPGTVAEVAKATVAISAETTEHESEVALSHLPPFSTSSLCDSLKTSFGVWLLPL